MGGKRINLCAIPAPTNRNAVPYIYDKKFDCLPGHCRNVVNTFDVLFMLKGAMSRNITKKNHRKAKKGTDGQNARKLKRIALV